MVFGAVANCVPSASCVTSLGIGIEARKPDGRFPIATRSSAVSLLHERPAFGSPAAAGRGPPDPRQGWSLAGPTRVAYIAPEFIGP